MKPFEYAAPRDESQLTAFLGDRPEETAVLAGGTDLVPLMQAFLVTPSRVVNIKEVAGFRGVSAGSAGVTIGAATPLDELAADRALAAYAGVLQAIAGINSMQLQAQGTLGGELLQWPRCWFFRNGHGLSADGGRLVVEGDNRYHAILGNSGPAKFVNASRIAPALIALQAQARLVGPGPDDESVTSVEALYRSPKSRDTREIALVAGQCLAQIQLPPAADWRSATYEVRHGEGPDDPLAAAAVALRLEGSRVSEARLVLGQVAPTPWPAYEASRWLVGREITAETAEEAADLALSAATPLSQNAYKVALARVSVKRALLRAVDLPTGGF